jgi:4-hydroxybenzoate polyprenyltransferase
MSEQIRSHILGIIAIINLFLIIFMPKWYIPIGVSYAVMHLIYQAYMKEGVFKFLRNEESEY